MLWIALHFPLLPLESFPPASSQSEPWAIADGPHVLVCNACARAQGVRVAMTLSAACALTPHLVYRQRNRATEALALDQLATWAGQFTPSVSLQPPDGLVLEIEGSLKLFGGLRPVLASIKRGCADMGYTVALAGAPTVSAAWLLARARIERIVVAKSALRDAIAALPVAVLDCNERELEALRAIGIRAVGELLALPREGVARRFGQQMLEQVDRALGALPEARAFFAIPPRFEATVEFASDVAQAEALLFSARRLLTQLAGFLNARCGGVQRFTVTLLHEDIAATVLEIGLATPTRELGRFVVLVRERFAAVSLAAPVRQIRIEADEIFALAGSTAGLFPDPAAAVGDGHRLIERLQARLGPDQVQGLSCCAEHRPELAWETTYPGTSPLGRGARRSLLPSGEGAPERGAGARLRDATVKAHISTRVSVACTRYGVTSIGKPTEPVPPLACAGMREEMPREVHDRDPRRARRGVSPGTRTQFNDERPRPLWLLAEPRPLRQVGSRPQYENEPLAVVAGPEIIETGWWNGDIKRDYFIAQTPALSTYWIYRERREPYAWYLHGIFG